MAKYIEIIGSRQGVKLCNEELSYKQSLLSATSKLSQRRLGLLLGTGRKTGQQVTHVTTVTITETILVREHFGSNSLLFFKW